MQRRNQNVSLSSWMSTFECISCMSTPFARWHLRTKHESNVILSFELRHSKRVSAETTTLFKMRNVIKPMRSVHPISNHSDLFTYLSLYSNYSLCIMSLPGPLSRFPRNYFSPCSLSSTMIPKLHFQFWDMSILFHLIHYVHASSI